MSNDCRNPPETPEGAAWEGLFPAFTSGRDG